MRLKPVHWRVLWAILAAAWIAFAALLFFGGKIPLGQTGAFKGSPSPRYAPARRQRSATSYAIRPADPKQVIYCDILRDRATVAECDYYQEIMDKLQTGEGGVRILPPGPVRRGDTATLRFGITADPKNVPVTVVLSGKPSQIVTLKIGRRMAMQLRGDGFKIDHTEIRTLDLFVGKQAFWEWQITPVRASRYDLLLSAYVIVPAADGTGKPTLLNTTDVPVEVQVTWSDRVNDVLMDSTAWFQRGTNWLKGLTLFVLAIGGLFTAVRKLRKKETKPSCSTA